MEKMLQNIKPDKATGPDSLPATMLKELSQKIAHILELIYCRSIRYNMALGNAYRVIFLNSQLLSLFHDLASVPTETDMIVMDVSKAFDKVSYRKLLYKLEWYGIRGGTIDWTMVQSLLWDLFCQEYLRIRFWALSSSSSTLMTYLMASPTVQSAFLQTTVFCIDMLPTRTTSTGSRRILTELPSGRRPG